MELLRGNRVMTYYFFAIRLQDKADALGARLRKSLRQGSDPAAPRKDNREPRPSSACSVKRLPGVPAQPLRLREFTRSKGVPSPHRSDVRVMLLMGCVTLIVSIPGLRGTSFPAH